MIKLTVIDRDDSAQEIEIPEGINLNLMEVLKASEYNILATCGGMALCATCHVQVLEGLNQLPEPQDAELDMLDTLPDATSESRLACQLKVNEQLEGIVIKIRGDIL
ncbi:2Fe-2S iron-sulfur cluster-binding protein [Pedobacter cryophilus]|uniref:2Fe-2S iron-sulfur cluster binding domain-containing protein n=1 Tax=Pedobacter cryophilus TaxID=2571271 RepID=A0A4U1BWU9_9SPHI|nr:2Fe-2S iron-sulfur cluster-binding protein [Pedobacter cryophilus]TKB95580.1 2Fe-2S iron-sulfur cluster binding domain-containing protein [Pedobacter cryophilus]